METVQTGLETMRRKIYREEARRVALRGDTDELKIWNRLKDAGMNDCGAAGMMGNLYAESGLKPNNLQNSYNRKFNITDEDYTALVDGCNYPDFVTDKAGYGLAQWTFWSRKQGLLNFTRARGVSIADLEAQLDFLMKELSEGYKGVLATLRTARTIAEASNVVLMQFEKPADQSEAVQKKRAEYSQTFFELFAGGSAGTSTAKTGGNSALATITVLSPNNSGKRTEKISKITIHHMAGNLTVEQCGATFASTSRKASSNYGIGSDGRIALYVPEEKRAWTSSSSWNDNRAVTIEVANSKAEEPWPISSEAYKSLVELCADICKRNGIRAVNYTGDKNGVLTEHRMFKATSCPGTTIHGYLTSGRLVQDINAKISGAEQNVITYKVKAGDSLWGIAVKHLGSGKRYTEIMQLNGLTDKTIQPGQTLKLPE